MQSRFTFLENKFPNLAAYGKKAEESLGHDNNISLLNLGRIAETITELLCTNSHSNYNTNTPETAQDLLKLGSIDEDICRKITTLTEIMADAAQNEYSSEMAATRLLTTAQELCEWFMSSYGSSRFDFLDDLFKPSASTPPLAGIADFGREAEQNLRANTRYCLICLGDVGEAVAEMLIDLEGVAIHEKDQLQRINMLQYRGVLDDTQKNTLHDLRMLRNKAVHNRYSSEEDGKKLLASSLPLCEWLFRLVVESGDIVRGYISSSDEEGLTVKIGHISGRVTKDEIPEGCTFKDGERKIFMVIDADSEDLSLSLKDVRSDPWSEAARKYSRYRKGQDVNAFISRITNTSGAFAELNDGLIARLPESEYGTKFPTSSPRQGQHIKARVKWLNPQQYPYMLLSIRDAESTPPEVEAPKPMPNKKFIGLCKTGTRDEILEAIDTGADVNAANHNGVSAFMTAVMYNTNPGVLGVLAENGVDVNAKNNNGNTALMYAAMFRTEDIVRELLEYGADVEAVNEGKHNALHYAKVSRKLRGNAELLGLLGEKQPEPEPEPEPVPVPEPEPEPVPVPEPEPVPEPVHTNISNDEFLALCRNGSPEDILYAVKHGANLFARDNNNNTGLILAAEHNNADAVKALISTSINTNSTNSLGNNALMTAAAVNSSEVVEALIEPTDNIDLQNNKENTALILAAESNTDDVVKVLVQNHAGLNITNNAGNTALMLAAWKNTSEVVAALLDAGADIHVTNFQGKTALMIAAWKNTPEVVAALLDAGADIHVKDFQGKTAYDFAVNNPKFSGSPVLDRLNPEPPQTPETPDPHELADALRRTLQRDILKICRSGNPDDISQAIDAGVKLNVRNKNGAAPLMFAARENTAQAVDLLIQADVDVNAQDNSGNTALVYAAAYNSYDVVDMLLNAGADVNIMNKSGHIAADYARKNNRLDGTDILERLSA